MDALQELGPEPAASVVIVHEEHVPEAATRDEDAIRLETRRHNDSEPTQENQFVFREMLSDEDAPVATYDQLERYGLFDVSICTESLAQYRAKYPLPEEITIRNDDGEQDEENVLVRRPSPQHRHSIAITPSSRVLPLNYSPPLASPGLATASARLSPFSLVRRTSRKDRRPAQPRTKSTNDVSSREAAVPPLLTPEDQVPTPGRRASIVSATEETPLANRTNLDRDTTIKDKRNGGGSGGGSGERAPRKLRRNPANRPPLPVIRTDDEFLLRPSSEYRSRSPSPARSPHSQHPSSTTSRTTKHSSWRTSLSNLVSPVSSPTSFEMPHEFNQNHHPSSPRNRSPSPIGQFPSTIRRETPLPPVDPRQRPRTRNDSLSDSYSGDSEKPASSASSASTAARSRSGGGGGQRSHSNSVSSIPSPSSPVSTGNLWARALKLGRRSGGPSRASSVASSSASTTSWDLIDAGEEHRGGGGGEKGTFEVLRSAKLSPQLVARPMTRRTSSEGASVGGSPKIDCENWKRRETRNPSSYVEGQIVEASTSSPNLSKISEYPESSLVDQRSPYHYLPNGSPPASIISGRGFHTPPITANSSKTILAIPPMTTTTSANDPGLPPLPPPSPSIDAQRVPSRSGLSTTTSGEEPLSTATFAHRNPSLIRSDASSSRTRSDSNASTTYRSTQSSSRSSSIRQRRGLGEGGGGGGPSSSSGIIDYSGDETGATSATDGEEEERRELEEEEARKLKREHLAAGDVSIPALAGTGIAI